MAWNKTPQTPGLTVIQRLQLLVLRLERLSAVQSLQRTRAVMGALTPPEDKT